LAWKLFHSRWNLQDWKGDQPPKRWPRILFLADRNILADQAYNAFSAFPEDALVRISPDVIRKQGRVPKNGHLIRLTSANTHPTFLTSSSSMSATVAAPTMKATGAAFWNIFLPPCSWV